MAQIKLWKQAIILTIWHILVLCLIYKKETLLFARITEEYLNQIVLKENNKRISVSQGD